MSDANVNTESLVRKLHLYCGKEQPKVTAAASLNRSDITVVGSVSWFRIQQTNFKLKTAKLEIPYMGCQSAMLVVSTSPVGAVVKGREKAM